jgi:hypothetical protein
MKTYFFVFFTLLTFTSLFAQVDTSDVLYMNDGMVFKGKIVEEREGVYIKLRGIDRHIFTAKVSEIKKVDRKTYVTNKLAPVYWRLAGGPGLPMGTFSDQPGRSGKFGFLFGGGATLNIENFAGLEFNGWWTRNAGNSTGEMPVDGAYEGFWLTSGVKYWNGNPEANGSYFSVGLGFAHFSLPSVEYSRYLNTRTGGRQSNGIAFSAGAGFIFQGRYEAGVQLLNTSVGRIDAVGQSISLLALIVAVRL